MSVRHERLAPLDEEIARHDWRSVGSFIGDGSLRREPSGVWAGPGRATTWLAYWGIDNVAMVDGRLSQRVGPLTPTLLVALDVAGSEGRPLIIDLLANIAGGYSRACTPVGPVALRSQGQQIDVRSDLHIAWSRRVA